ncbi:hypothetical protein ACFLZK_00345 [Patescibacteria group bacterium]
MIFRKKFDPKKVTPLSKGLALALFIAMPFIGFCLGIRYQKTLDSLEIHRLEIENSILKTVNEKIELLD